MKPKSVKSTEKSFLFFTRKCLSSKIFFYMSNIATFTYEINRLFKTSLIAEFKFTPAKLSLIIIISIMQSQNSGFLTKRMSLTFISVLVLQLLFRIIWFGFNSTNCLNVWSNVAFAFVRARHDYLNMFFDRFCIEFLLMIVACSSNTKNERNYETFLLSY